MVVFFLRSSERQVDVTLHLAAAEAVDHGDHGGVFAQLVLFLLQLLLQLTLLQLQRRSLKINRLLHRWTKTITSTDQLQIRTLMLASFLACSVLLSSFLRTSTVSSRSPLSRSFSLSFSSSARSSPRRPEGAMRMLTDPRCCWRKRPLNRRWCHTHLWCHCFSAADLIGGTWVHPLSPPTPTPSWQTEAEPETAALWPPCTCQDGVRCYLSCCSCRFSWFFLRESFCLESELWAACRSFNTRSLSLNLWWHNIRVE